MARRDRCSEVSRPSWGHVGMRRGTLRVAERPGDLLDHVVHPVGLGANVGPVRRHHRRSPAASVSAPLVLHHREPDRAQQAGDLLAPELRRRSGCAPAATGTETTKGSGTSPRTSSMPSATRSPARSRPAAGRSAAPTARCPTGRSRARSAPTPRCAGRGAWRCGRSPWARNRPPRGAPRSCVSAISDEAPPMIPPIPTGVPSASQMRQSSPVSPRLRPRTPTVRCHAVERLERLTRPGPADDQPPPGQARQVVGVGGLAELEHHVVRGVDHVVDRAHAGQEQPAGDPARRRPDRDVVEHRDGEARAQVGRLHHGRRRRLDRPAARCRLGRLGRGEGEAEAGRQVAGDPDDGPGVGAVALDGDVEDDVGLEAQRLGQRRARLTRRLVAEDQEAGAVVGEPELLPRAEHPVGHDAAHLAPLDLEAAGEDGADRAPAGHGRPPRSCARRRRSRAARRRRRPRPAGCGRRP